MPHNNKLCVDVRRSLGLKMPQIEPLLQYQGRVDKGQEQEAKVALYDKVRRPPMEPGAATAECGGRRQFAAIARARENWNAAIVHQGKLRKRVNANPA